MRETELAAHVIRYVEALGWTIGGEEVRVPDLAEDGETPPRVDIVAVKGPKRWAIEVKNRMGMDLLAQGCRLQTCFHMVSMAWPETPQVARHALSLADRLGLGVLRINANGAVRRTLDPRTRAPSRTAGPDLVPEHRSGDYAPAGSPGGGGYSPFADLRRMVVAWVGANPGCAPAELMAAIPERLDSLPRLLGWLKSGALGVEMTGTGANRRVWVEAPRMPNKP